MLFNAKVVQVGDDIAAILPDELLARLGAKAGDEVEATITEGVLTLYPIGTKPPDASASDGH